MTILKYLKIGSFIGKTNLSVNMLLDFLRKPYPPFYPVDARLLVHVHHLLPVSSKNWGLENIGREARGVEGNKNREQKASFGGKEYFPTETTVVYELRRP